MRVTGVQTCALPISLKAYQTTPLFVERTPLIVHRVQPHRVHTRHLWQQVFPHMLLFVPWQEPSLALILTDAA